MEVRPGMKREILCPDCYKSALRSAGVSASASQEDLVRCLVTPPERTKYVTGTLHHACYCDVCNKPMSKGDDAVARSIWSDVGGVSYYEWESEYL